MTPVSATPSAPSQIPPPSNGSLVAEPTAPPDAEPTAPPDTARTSTVRGLIKTIRPHQWVKNLFVLAPMFFHKDVFVTGPNGVPALNLVVTGRAFAATIVFCLLAGAVYTIND